MGLKIDSKLALFSDGLWWSKKVPKILIDVHTLWMKSCCVSLKEPIVNISVLSLFMIRRPEYF